MSKNRRGRVVRCEYCGGSGWVKVQSTKRRRRSARSRGQTFETTATAIAPNGWAPGSNGLRPAPKEPEFDPIDEAPLSPGESRSSKLYHQWSSGDVWVSALIAGLSGVAIGVPGTIICIALKTKVVWPLLTLTVPPAIMWGLKVKDFFDNDKAIARVQTHDRPTEAPPIIQAPPKVNFVINSGKKQTRATLTAPKSNHAGLWEYAGALLRGTAAASIDGGKGDDGILGAKRFGYTPAEFDAGPGTWRPTAIAGGILEDDPTKSKGYRLTPDGRRAMAQIAKYQRDRVFV